jgi:hypothetical protein
MWAKGKTEGKVEKIMKNKRTERTQNPKSGKVTFVSSPHPSLPFLAHTSLFLFLSFFVCDSAFLSTLSNQNISGEFLFVLIRIKRTKHHAEG